MSENEILYLIELLQEINPNLVLIHKHLTHFNRKGFTTENPGDDWVGLYTTIFQLSTNSYYICWFWCIDSLSN